MKKLFTELNKHFTGVTRDLYEEKVYIPFPFESQKKLLNDYYIIQKRNKYLELSEPNGSHFWINLATGQNCTRPLIKAAFPKVTFKVLSILQEFYTPNSVKFIGSL